MITFDATFCATSAMTFFHREAFSQAWSSQSTGSKVRARCSRRGSERPYSGGAGDGRAVAPGVGIRVSSGAGSGASGVPAVSVASGHRGHPQRRQPCGGERRSRRQDLGWMYYVRQH